VARPETDPEIAAARGFDPEDAIDDDEELLLVETLLGITGTAAMAVPKPTAIM